MLDHIVANETPASIEDVLFRRTGSGWSADLGLSEVSRAADALALLGDDRTVRAEIDAYKSLLEKTFLGKAIIR